MDDSTVKNRVLVIDDTVSIINMVKTALENHNHQVLMATSGLKGISIAQKAKPDLILLDILMPEIDGYETCRRLKADDQTKEIPIIFMSALSEIFDKVKAFNLGAVDYVTKPLSIEELLARVKTQLKLYQMQRKLQDTNKWLSQEVEQSTQELRLSQEKYQTVADFASDWEYWLLPDGSIEYMSPSCESITGYTVEEFVANPQLINDIIYVDDKHMWRQHLDHESGNVDHNKEMAFRIITKKREEIWIGHVCKNVYDRNGYSNGVRVSNRDISAIKLAESELQLKNHKLLAAEAKLLSANEALHNNVKTLKINELRLKERNEEIQAAEEELKASNDALRNNIKYLYKSEDLLKESQRIGKVGSWEFNAANNKLIWSDEVFRMIGVEPKSFIPSMETYLEYIHPEDRELVNHVFAESIEQKNPIYEVEHRFINKESSEISIAKEIGNNIFNEKGEYVKTIGMTRDITQQKKDEGLLKATNEELKAAEEELTESNSVLKINLAKLTESEEKLNAAQKLAKLGHYNLDFKTGFWSSSTELDHLFGINESYERNVDGWLNIVSPGYRKEMLDYFTNEIVGKHIPFDKEYKIVNHKTKKEAWVHGLGTLHIDNNGNLIKMLGSIQDITQRKLVEIEKEQVNILLQTERDLLQALMDNIPDTIYFKDLDSKFTRINNAQANLLGISAPEKAIGNSDFDYFLKEHADKAYKEEQEIFKTGKPLINKVDELIKPNSEKRWLSTTKVPVFNKNGEVSSLVGVTRDITEQRKIQEHLAYNENLLRQSQAIGHVGSWEYNILKDELIWSDETFRIFGIDKNKVKPTNDLFFKCIHADDVLSVDEAFKKSIKAKEKGYEIEHRIIHNKTKNIRYVLERSQHIYNSNGEVVKSIGMVSDITDRKLAVIELEANKNKFQILYEKAPLSYQSLDSKGLFIDINPAWEQTFGFAKTEVIGKHFSEFMTVESKKKQKEAFSVFLNCGSVEKAEFEMIKKDKSRIFINLYGNVTYDDNNIAIKTHCIIADVTEQRKAEIALVEKNEALQAAEEKLMASNDALKENLEMLTESQVRFKALHNASFGGIAIHDMGIILETNLGLSEISGYSYEELKGLNGLLLVAEKNRDDVLDKMKSGFEEPYESIGLRKDGSEYPLRLEGRNIPYKGKKVRVVEFRDITERKEAEKIVLESEERYRNLQENMQSGVIVYKPANNGLDFEIIGINKSAELISEISATELIGKFINKIIPDFEKSDIYKVLQKVNKTGNPTRMEPLLNLNGKWTENQIYKLPDGEIVAIFDDVTERKKADSKLQESENRFRMIIETANDAIFIAEANTGLLVDVNKKGQELLGIPREKIVGMHQSELHPEYKKDQMILNFENDVKSDNSEIMHQVEIKAANGTIIPVEVSPATLKLGDGKEYLVGFFRDITKRKVAEMALQESRERFKQLADTANEGIIIHDNGSILDINNSIIQLTGYNEEELHKKRVDEMIISKKYWPILVESLKHDSPPPFEIEIVTKNGVLIPVEIRARSIFRSNNSLRVISIRDITEQKQMQQKLLQAIISTEEQERKRVAQELHDGIGPILSTVKLYTETYFKSDNKEFKEKVKQQLMVSINEALKQISAISNNLSPHVLDDFGLKAAIEKFIEKLQSIHKVEFDFAYNVKPKINKEIETTLYRVCIELINNSMKHANAKSVIISIIEKDGFIIMNYLDNGSGFDFEVVKRGKGGMGLFNIVNRVKSLGGSVEFKNKDKGIQYDFEIPL